MFLNSSGPQFSCVPGVTAKDRIGRAQNLGRKDILISQLCGLSCGKLWFISSTFLPGIPTQNWMGPWFPEPARFGCTMVSGWELFLPNPLIPWWYIMITAPGLLVWYVVYLVEALFFNPTAKGLMRLKQTVPWFLDGPVKSPKNCPRCSKTGSLDEAWMKPWDFPWQARFSHTLGGCLNLLHLLGMNPFECGFSTELDVQKSSGREL